MPVLAIGAAVSLAAGFVQGLTGFGFVLAFVPAMLWFQGTKGTVLAAVALGLLLSALIMWQTRGGLEPRRMVPLLVAAVAGVPAGTWLLARLPVAVLRPLVNVAVLVIAAAWLVWRPRLRPGGDRAWLAPLAGFVGGVINGSTGLGGPPVAMLVAALGWPPDRSRGTLAAFNLSTYAVTLAVAAWSGLLDSTQLLSAIAWLVPALIGSFLGARVAARVSPARFPVILAGTVLVCSAVALLSLTGAV